MKKLLSSLVILTLIISSFSCVAFAEKNWIVPLEDFSTEPNPAVITSNNPSLSNDINNGWMIFRNKGSETEQWHEDGQYYELNNTKQSNLGYAPFDSKGVYKFTEADGKQYLVFKILVKNPKTERVSVTFRGGNTTSNTLNLMEICNDDGMSIFYPTPDSATNYNQNDESQIVLEDYYGDGWVDAVAVAELYYSASAVNYPVTIYANGEKVSSTFSSVDGSKGHEMAGILSGKGINGIRLSHQTAGADTFVDDIGMYIVKDSAKPALTASVNNFTVTTSNEVPLALLANGNLSKIKANGKYLPLEAIKANKGGLSFEIDEDYLTAGENIIDLSEVKDILGTSISGTATFTMTKELKEKEVPSTIDVSYNDKKGANTVTSRFFAPITSLDFAKVVFEISTIFEETPYTWKVELDEVYENVTVNDTVYSKTGAYVATAALGDVPSDFDGDFEVNAYAVDFEGNSVPLN